jgi:hypothetical protein
VSAGEHGPPERPDLEPGRAVFVLGVDRSGTSAIAEVLMRRGVSAGPPGLLVGPDEHNPRGYWESFLVQGLLHDLLAATGFSQWEERFPEELAQRAREEEWRSRVRLIVELMGPGPWFWKEPHLSLTLPLWAAVVKRPVSVIMLRNPAASARSFAVFPGGSESRSTFYSRWQHFMHTIATDRSLLGPTIVVSYEALTSDPVAQCARVASFLARHLGESPVEDPVAAMADCVKREHVHWTLAKMDGATAGQRELYREWEALSRRSDDVRDSLPQTPHGRLSPSTRRYLSALERSLQEQRARAWTEEANRLRAEGDLDTARLLLDRSRATFAGLKRDDDVALIDSIRNSL